MAARIASLSFTHLVVTLGERPARTAQVARASRAKGALAVLRCRGSARSLAGFPSGIRCDVLATNSRRRTLTGSTRTAQTSKPAHRRHRFRRTVAVVGCCVIALTACDPGPHPSPFPSPATNSAATEPFVPPFVGTLGTRPNRAADESGNGIRMAMMELNWGLYEPEEGQFDVDYENQMKTKL